MERIVILESTYAFRRQPPLWRFSIRRLSVDRWESRLTGYDELGRLGSPIMIENTWNVDLFASLFLRQKSLRLDLHADVGCRKNDSVYAQGSVSVYDRKIGRTAVEMVSRSDCSPFLILPGDFPQTTQACASILGHLEVKSLCGGKNECYGCKMEGSAARSRHRLRE